MATSFAEQLAATSAHVSIHAAAPVETTGPIMCMHGRQVRIVEFSEATPFEEQLAAMAATGVLVSVHTSNLANAQFLPPGRAVVELLQKNWVWQNLDRSFQARAPAHALHIRNRVQILLLPKRRSHAGLLLYCCLKPLVGSRPSAAAFRRVPLRTSGYPTLTRCNLSPECVCPCGRVGVRRCRRR